MELPSGLCFGGHTVADDFVDGEARDKNGKVLARAVCEATMQRFSEWLDSADKAETRIGDLKSKVNRTFGRRFLITSIRWLNLKEI